MSSRTSWLRSRCRASEPGVILAARSIALLVLIAAVGILGQWSGPISADAWRIPAAAWILALVLEGFTSARSALRIHRELPTIAYLGQPFHSRIVVHNPARVPVHLETADAHAGGLAPSTARKAWVVAPDSKRHVDVILTAERLGTLQWQHLYLRRLGRFRLAWWRRQISLPASIRVMPDYLRRAGDQTGTTGQGRHERPMPGSGQELFGFREYRRGDPLRTVDWKATARRGTPIVRIPEAEQRIAVVLVLDTGRGSSVRAGALNRLGHYVNVAARLAEEAIQRGDHVCLVSYADRVTGTLPALHGRSGVLRIRSHLAGLSPIARESNPLGAALRVRHVARQRSLVLMFTEVDEGEAAQQLLQAIRLLMPRHLPVLASIEDPDTLAMRWRADANWHSPYDMLAALELTREKRRTHLRLQRAGAHVVSAPPEQLDERIRRTYERLRARHRV